MKQALASFAVFIYFTFMTGVMVNIHYCMDRYDSFKLYKTASDWCGTCGMHAKKSGCCHDEISFFKLKDDHQTSAFTYNLKSPEPAIAELPEFIVTEKSISLSIDHLNHSPPLLSPPEIYLQNRVFRI